MTEDVKAGVARLFDEMSSSYNEIVPFHTYFGEQLVEAAGVAEGDRVLDVATGQGACLIPAAHVVGDRGAVVGIDISREMIKRLQHAIEDAGIDHVHVALMDAERMEFPDKSFDVSTCTLRIIFLPRSHADDVRICSSPSAGRHRPGWVATRNDSLGYPWFGDVIAPFLPDDGPPPDAAPSASCTSILTKCTRSSARSASTHLRAT